MSSTSRHSFARIPFTPSGVVQKMSAWSRRTFPLVGQPREAAGARQHAQQRHFGQADRRRSIVHEHDLVARERQLVPAAGRGAVARGEELQPRVPARVLDAVARLVGDLQKFTFHAWLDCASM